MSSRHNRHAVAEPLTSRNAFHRSAQHRVNDAQPRIWRRHLRCVMFFTPEQAFRKLYRIEPQFSRTGILTRTTDQAMGNTATETFNPRQDKTSNAHHIRRTTMLRKITLALVAAASLSALALAPTTASAGFKGGNWGGGNWGGGWHHNHWGHGFGFGVGYIGGGDDGCYQTRRVMTPYGMTFRTVNVCAY
jgi:hypothetical protein